MTNLEIVRQAVIKAVPEVMDLKFGCRVLIKDDLLMSVKGLQKKDTTITVLSECSDPDVYLLLHSFGCCHQ